MQPFSLRDKRRTHSMAVLPTLWSWPKSKQVAQPLAPSKPTPPPPAQSEASQSFYQQAIEWTHRADKVINLVLGYLLAIASVLGFMDVLSNGEVLSSVPYAFYIWLAIMGLGVDFQILLVIGRIPDLARTVENGMFRAVFFAFNILFLAFLCYMSVIIAAVFTQHRDVPGTIAQAMQALGIVATRFVYERAALATLLLVLMAVDRTMERWRMQLMQPTIPPTNGSIPAQVTPEQPVQTNAADIEKLLTAMQAMNQQTLQAMASMHQQSMQVTIEQVTRVTVEAVRDTLTTLPMYQPPAQIAALSVSPQVQGEKQEGITSDSHTIEGENGGEKSESYGERIEALYKRNKSITVTEIVEQTGCSTSTAHKWLKRLQPAQ